MDRGLAILAKDAQPILELPIGSSIRATLIQFATRGQIEAWAMTYACAINCGYAPVEATKIGEAAESLALILSLYGQDEFEAQVLASVQKQTVDTVLVNEGLESYKQAIAVAQNHPEAIEFLRKNSSLYLS